MTTCSTSAADRTGTDNPLGIKIVHMRSCTIHICYSNEMKWRSSSMLRKYEEPSVCPNRPPPLPESLQRSSWLTFPAAATVRGLSRRPLSGKPSSSRSVFWSSGPKPSDLPNYILLC